MVTELRRWRITDLWTITDPEHDDGLSKNVGEKLTDHLGQHLGSEQDDGRLDMCINKLAQLLEM